MENIYFVQEAIASTCVDPERAKFLDVEAERLHDKTVYERIKANCVKLSPIAIAALLESLDAHDLDLIDQCTDLYELHWQKHLIIRKREASVKQKPVPHRPNGVFDKIFDDYVNRRKGKLVEAKRQLRNRFDGLDHDMQERVMMAFMTLGHESERKFVAEKLLDEDFWEDNYIPLVQKWWEEYRERPMAGVVVKRCSREYILAHLEELEGMCNYANLCLKTGIEPKEEKLLPRTYLYVLKTNGVQLRFREGERVVLGYVREMLYEKGEDKQYEDIYGIPYVQRMMHYLGEMGLVDDIIAIDDLNQRMREMPEDQRISLAIKAIENEFSFPEYIR